MLVPLVRMRCSNLDMHLRLCSPPASMQSCPSGLFVCLTRSWKYGGLLLPGAAAAAAVTPAVTETAVWRQCEWEWPVELLEGARTGEPGHGQQRKQQHGCIDIFDICCLCFFLLCKPAVAACPFDECTDELDAPDDERRRQWEHVPAAAATSAVWQQQQQRPARQWGRICTRSIGWSVCDRSTTSAGPGVIFEQQRLPQ